MTEYGKDRVGDIRAKLKDLKQSRAALQIPVEKRDTSMTEEKEEPLLPDINKEIAREAKERERWLKSLNNYSASEVDLTKEDL